MNRGQDYAMPPETHTLSCISQLVSQSANASPSYLRPNGSHVDDAGCRLYFFVMYGLLMGGLCIVGVVLNAICFAVFWNDKVNTSTTFFFKALAVVDIALLLTAFPIFSLFYGLLYINGYESSGYSKVYPYIMVYVWPWALVAQTANVWLTMLIGISRYIAVCRPYHSCRLCTVSQARRQLVIVLLAAILYNLPRFFTFRMQAEQQAVNNTTNITKFEAHETGLAKDNWYNILYNNVAYVIFLLLGPLVVLGALNYLLIRALAKMRRRRASMQSASQQQDTSVTLVLVILVVIFIVCQLPALVQQILRNVLSQSALDCGGLIYYLRPVSNVLVTLNSVINFFVYVTFNTRFRQQLAEMIRCGRGLDRTTKYAMTAGSGDFCRAVSYSRVPLSRLPTTTLKPAEDQHTTDV